MSWESQGVCQDEEGEGGGEQSACEAQSSVHQSQLLLK